MEITIVGLGPGSFAQMTLDTWEIISKAKKLLVRTVKHPTVAELEVRGIKFTSFDHIYEEKNDFADVYKTIAKLCIEEVYKHGNLVYAVPGSPLVAEKSVEFVKEIGEKQGVKVTIVPALSFLEVLFVRLGLDPIKGVTIVDAYDLSVIPAELPTDIIVTQLYNKSVASDVKLTLMDTYPDDHLVTIVHSLGLPEEKVKVVPLFELDRIEFINHLTSLYVPALKERSRRFNLEPLTQVMAKLRSPQGCIWDIEQTHTSLRRYIIEEVYEVLEAIDDRNTANLCEELGDLLLQVVFHARMAEEAGKFSMQDVIDEVTNKMIRRHPHVFGDISVRDAGEVLFNWEQIKKQEKGIAAEQRVLGGVPKGLPGLMRAFKLQSKAAKVGFDWTDAEPVWQKVQEEIAEFSEAVLNGNNDHKEAELGDLLFAVVNLARFYGIEPEVALHTANNKFIRRFNYVEDMIAKQKVKWQNTTLEQMDKWWEEAKQKGL